MPVHAFDQPETLLGQGTVGLELEADMPDVDSLLVAVGGGGLIGGIAAWYASRVKVVGVESDGAPTLFADTRSVLQNVLGLSESEISGLVESEAIAVELPE